MLVRLRTILIAAALLFPFSTQLSADKKYHGGALDARQHGYEHGYRDGYHTGREEREARRKFDVNSHDYKEGDRGYEKYMGDKDQYKEGYREGYQVGYPDGYNLRPGQFGAIYGPPNQPPVRGRDPLDDIYVTRGYGVSDVAFDIGYRDGVLDGTRDMNSGRGFRPEDQQMYRDADHGYRGVYGDRDAYRSRYRDGYTQGYRDGFGRIR